MTTKQVDYADRVAHALDGLTAISCGACPGCEECGLGDIDTMDCPEFESAGEAFFSWSTCDACNSDLGGDRHPAHGLDTDSEIVHLTICVDCVFYLSYGDLPA